MPKDLSVAEAKAHFADCLRTAERGESVVITRHGKPVAAIVPAGDLAHLERLRAAGPAGGLASIAGGWEGSEELVAIVERQSRTRGRTPRRR
jgi:prevent-host-death family protein